MISSKQKTISKIVTLKYAVVIRKLGSSSSKLLGSDPEEFRIPLMNLYPDQPSVMGYARIRQI